MVENNMAQVLFSSYFSVFCVLLLRTINAQSCPHVCSCNDGVVDCGGRDLRFLPDLPTNAISIRLDDNRIETLPYDAFKGMAELQILTLARNRLRTVPANAFKGASQLMSLDLSNNELESLNTDSFKGLPHLITLSLAYNTIPSLAESLKNVPDLNSLNVGYNRLMEFSETDFQQCTNIKMMDLSNNNIKKIHKNTFKNVAKLRYLFIQHNPLGAEFPELDFGESHLQLLDFTNCSLTHVPRVLPPTLSDLRLGQNRIKIVNETDIRNITRLQLLTLNDNEITNVIYRTFRGMKNLKELWLNHNKLVYIPRDLPSSLRKLYMDNNLIDQVEANLFKNDSQLEYLSMEMNRIEMISEGTFHNLSELKHLDLKANKLRDIKTGTFDHLPSLECLDLSNNPIESIAEDAFNDLDNVTKLSMSYVVSSMTKLGDNFLSAMPNVETVELINSPGLVIGLMNMVQYQKFEPLGKVKSVNLMYSDMKTMPSQVRDWFPQIHTILLDGNPWVCDTRLLWLQDWIRSADMTFYTSEAVVCDLPEELHGQKLWQIETKNFKPPVEGSFPLDTDQKESGDYDLAAVETSEEDITTTPTEATTATTEATTTEATTTTEPTTTTVATTTTTTEATTTARKKRIRGRRPYPYYQRRKLRRRRRRTTTAATVTGPSSNQGGVTQAPAVQPRRRKFNRRRKNRKRYRSRKPQADQSNPAYKSLKIRHPHKKAERKARRAEEEKNKKAG